MTEGKETGTRQAPAGRMAFSVEQGAEQIGITRTAFYGLIRTGEIKTFKVGRRRLVTRTELQRFVQAKVQEATA